MVAIKLDEDLSPLVAEPLVAAGFDVATVWSQGWSGMSDAKLLPKVVHEKRVFVTADKGFSDLRTYPPGKHYGIVVLRPDRESIVDYRAMLASLLAKQPLDAVVGCLVIVSSRGVRVRRPSSE